MNTQQHIHLVDSHIKSTQAYRDSLVTSTPVSKIDAIGIKYARATGLKVGTFTIDRRINDDDTFYYSVIFKLDVLSPSGFTFIGKASILDDYVYDRFSEKMLNQRIEFEERFEKGEFVAGAFAVA